MEKALIFGASGGIGAALTTELATRRFDVSSVSRSVNGLDFSDPQSVKRICDRLVGPFNLIFIATGVLAPVGKTPERSVGAIDPSDMSEVFQSNVIGPAIIMQNLPRLMARNARIGVLSARVGSIGDNKIGGWHSYRSSKAALNQVVKGAAIEFARTNKGSICVALHPGTVETSFTKAYAGRHKTVPAFEAARNLVDVLTGLTVEQSGGFYDFSGLEVAW